MSETDPFLEISPAALERSGTLALQQGQYEEAARHLARAAQHAPLSPSLLYSYACALIAIGEPYEALGYLDRLITIQPALPDPHIQRAAALLDARDGTAALAAADSAVRLAPGSVEPLIMRARVLLALRRVSDAGAVIDIVLQTAPMNIAALELAGSIVSLQGHPEVAAEVYKDLLAAAPGYADGLAQQALMQMLREREPSGLRLCERALLIKSDSLFALNVKGFGLLRLGRFAQAALVYAAVLRISPEDAEGWLSLGAALLQDGRAGEAETALRRAIALRPDDAKAYANLGYALARQKRHSEVAAAFETAMGLNPHDVKMKSALLMSRAYVCDWRGRDAMLADTLAAIEAGEVVMEPFEALALYDDPRVHKRCAELAAGVVSAGTKQHRPRPRHGDKIRIGYLSSDFHAHATAYLMAEVFERHDRDRFEIIAFSAGPVTNDAMQRRLRGAFDAFHDVSPLTNAQMADAIAEAGVEIAVDLKGFTDLGHTGALAGRPAPVQVNFLGYPGTLGAAFIDYLIADAVVTPPGCEALYAEEIVRLPGSYQPNSARAPAPATTRAAHGLPQDGLVFCCFNSPYKITPAIFATWMRILQAMPGSVLWLLSGEPGVAANLSQSAIDLGIDPARLVFAPNLGHAEHLARLALADIVLDTAPYGAHTTASDALWAGVPIITCAGESFASRVAASLLTSVGAPELNRADRADYEAFAISLAHDADMRAAISRRLAAARETSALFDAEAYTRDLERAYEAMAARSRAGLAPQGFDLLRAG